MLVLPSKPLVRLADIWPSCLAALDGEPNLLNLRPAAKAAVLLVDGLGAINLRDREGHARWLCEAWRKRDLVADSCFPSTTSSALASLMTGADSGQHGLVGYKIRDPDSGSLVNHLKSWGPSISPSSWQLSETIFQKALNKKIPSLAMGEHRFVGSDFTEAVWRGATFVGTDSLEHQFKLMRDFFDANDRGLVYLYWPALDRAGHASGVGSDSWTRKLEALDTALGSLDRILKPDEGLIITADHGMVDVPIEGKLMIEPRSPLLKQVSEWAGEPRAVQLYLENSDLSAQIAEQWSSFLDKSATVLTRHEAIHGGFFGQVADKVAPRIGDILILAHKKKALYRTDLGSIQSKKMVGHHGSISSEEREIPIIPIGAWL